MISGTLLAQMVFHWRKNMDSLDIMGVICAVTALIQVLVH
jgi:hypothetical protein